MTKYRIMNLIVFSCRVAFVINTSAMILDQDFGQQYMTKYLPQVQLIYRFQLFNINYLPTNKLLVVTGSLFERPRLVNSFIIGGRNCIFIACCGHLHCLQILSVILSALIRHTTIVQVHLLFQSQKEI